MPLLELILLKILLATYFSLPHIGGLNRFVEIVKEQLLKNGHEVDILAHHPDTRYIHLVHTNHVLDKQRLSKVVMKEMQRYYKLHLPHVDSWIFSREMNRYIFELMASQFNLSKYDLIHSQDVISSRALRRVKPPHIPLVTSIHGQLAKEMLYADQIRKKNDSRWNYVSKEEYYGCISSDRIIVPSQWLQQELLRTFGLKMDSVKVIPFGCINLPAFFKEMKRPPETPVQKDPNKWIICCVARLNPEKGHRYLIEALTYLKTIRKDFVCWFVGDGPLKNELQSYCKKNSVNKHVVFLGNRNDVPTLLEYADYVVLPSIQENMPIAIMEAQVAGKALVASDVGGIPEMITHEETGLIFRRGDSGELARCLHKLMENKKMKNHIEIKSQAWGTSQWSSETLYKRLMNEYTNLTGSQGLIKDDYKGQKNINQIFGFNTHIRNGEEWGPLLMNLPEYYSIPDPLFTNALSQKKK